MARTRRLMSSATKRPAERTTTIRLPKKVLPPATDSRPSDGEANSPLKEAGISQESLEQLEDLASRCGIANSGDSNARALGDQSRTDVTLQQKVEFLEEFAGIWQQYALTPSSTYSRIEDSGNTTIELQNCLSQYLEDVVASTHEKAQRYFKRLTAQTWNGEKLVGNSKDDGTLAGEEDDEERCSAKSTVQAAATWTPLRLFLLVGMRAISSWRTLLGMCELAEASQHLLAWDEVFDCLQQERRVRKAGAPLGLYEAKKHGKTGFGRGINIKSEWSPKELEWAKERVTKEVQKRQQQSGVASLEQDVATGEEDDDEQSRSFEKLVLSAEAHQASQARREALKEMQPRVGRRAKPKARLPSPNPRDGLGSGSSPERSPEMARGAKQTAAPAPSSPSPLQPRFLSPSHNSSRDSSPSGNADAVPSPHLSIDNSTQADTADKDESFGRSPEYHDEDQNDDAGFQLNLPESESTLPLTTPTRLSDMLQGFTSSSASRKRGISATCEDMPNKYIKEAVPSGNAAKVRAIMTPFNNAEWARNEEDLNLWMKVWTDNVPDGLRHFNFQLGNAVQGRLHTGERCCVLVTQEQARASPVAVAYIEPSGTDDTYDATIFVPRHEGQSQSESCSLVTACLSVLRQLTGIHTGLDQHNLEEAAQRGLQEGFLSVEALTVDFMTPEIHSVPLQYHVMAAAAAFCTRTAQLLQEMVWSSNFWSFAMDIVSHQLSQNKAESAGSAGQVDTTGVPTTLRLPSARDVENRARTVATSSGPQSKKNTHPPRYSSAGTGLVEEVKRLRDALKAHHGLAQALATNCLLFLKMLDVVRQRCQEASEAPGTELHSTGNDSKLPNLKRRIEELKASIEDLKEEIAFYQKSIEEIDSREKQSGQSELTKFQSRRREEAQHRVDTAEKKLREKTEEQHRTVAELAEEVSASEGQQRKVQAQLEHVSRQNQALEKVQDRSFLILGYFTTSVHLYAQMSDRLKTMD
ncbi:hypothetical protein AC578_1277 [Pseudocercospora eumusae]|uniref:Uncharacterized protein n=1 Tax=Pseudocercospora eumusae TaxID=321146 RepID=A0A139HUK1_9PEZI|nr:hypothetical protein AC578_1277 [Pseudocercospora eumusae]